MMTIKSYRSGQTQSLFSSVPLVERRWHERGYQLVCTGNKAGEACSETLQEAGLVDID